MEFDVNIANKHLKSLLRRYKIKVIKWSKSSCGRAYYYDKTVKIPAPTDVDRFCICMHEIKHIIDGKWGKLYEREYACEKYAIEQANSLGFDTTEYKNRARGYVIMCIAKGHCRKLNLDSINSEIEQFCGIDFNEWKGKTVFISNWYGHNGLIIDITNKNLVTKEIVNV